MTAYKPADFKFQHHGSLWLVQPMNRAAIEHLQENVEDSAQWFGGSLVVEPRYVDGLADGLINNGFTVGR